MNHAFIESRKAVEQARQALRSGDRAAALKWGQEAARLAPDTEDPWLILAAVASPQASIDYIKKALEANPDSARARKGMAWAMQRLQAGGQMPPAPEDKTASRTGEASPAGSRTAKLLLPALLLTLGCVVVLFAAWSAVRNPAMAAIRSLRTPQETLPAPRPQSWAQAELPKPTYTATVLVEPAATQTPSPEPSPTPQPTSTPEAAVTADVTANPEASATIEPAATPEAAATLEELPTPGLLKAVIVEDTPTSEYAAPTPGLAQPAAVLDGASGGRWIDVDLSRQMVTAFDGETPVNSFIVSTGTWQTPTVTGTYHIWIKLKSTTMTGPGYYLPNVPYTMYFYKGYGLHGTYWHNNFGTPMSHGCVNLRTSDAEWLYNFASVGTTVYVHY